MHIYNKLLIGSLVFTLCGCFSGSNGALPNSASGAANQAGLTINQSGVVPVFGSPTSTLTYVHNDSDTVINQINYAVRVNDDDQGSQVLQFVNQLKSKLSANLTAGVTANQISLTNPQACSSIPAHSSCPLAFTTPALSNGGAGNSLLTVSYPVQGQLHSLSQVISFRYQQLTTAQPSLALSVPTVYTQNSIATHSTIYASGSGSLAGLLSNPKINLVNGKITNGYLANQNIGVGQVMALDVDTDAATQAYLASAISSVDPGSLVTSNFMVNPVALGAALQPSLASVIMVGSSANALGSIALSNLGQAAAPFIKVSSSNPTQLSASGCSAGLAAAQGCILNLKVNSQTSGSAILFIDYGAAAALSIPVQWSAATGDSLIISPGLQQLSLYGGESLTSQVSLANLGNSTLSNLSFSAQELGGAGNLSASLINNDCSITSFAPGQNCQLQLTVNAATASQGQAGSLLFKVSGVDQKGIKVSFQSLIDYNVIPAQPFLNYSPEFADLTTSQGSSSANLLKVNITNGGQAAANLSGFRLSGGNTYLTIANDECASLPQEELAAGQSCNVSFQLSGHATNNAAESASGTANYNINYSGGSLAINESLNFIESWNITSADANLVLANIAISNGAGSGTLADPYVFYSSAGLKPQSLSLTYTNMAKAANAQLDNVTLNVLPGLNQSYWSVDSADSTCGVSGVRSAVSLKPGQSCSLVLNNSIWQHPTLLSQDGTAAGDFVLPQVSYTDNNNVAYNMALDYHGNSKIYSSNRYGVITNNVSYNSLKKSVDLTQTYLPEGSSNLVSTQFGTAISQLATAAKNPLLENIQGNVMCSTSSAGGGTNCSYVSGSPSSVSYRYVLKPTAVGGMDYQLYTLTSGNVGSAAPVLAPAVNLIMEY